MAVDDPDELDEVDLAIRANELRHQADELAGGEMTAWEADDCPPDLAAHFWQHVIDYETAPLTTHFDQLAEAGVALPDPDSLADADLTATLWEVVRRLADIRVFLWRTNHLSDRELYAHLWTESLREPVPDLPGDTDGTWTIDMLGGCSEEDMRLNFRYYADDAERAEWLAHFPGDDMPPREPPPYDRDRHLPRGPH